jgi:hypothetical protein
VMVSVRPICKETKNGSNLGGRKDEEKGRRTVGVSVTVSVTVSVVVTVTVGVVCKEEQSERNAEEGGRGDWGHEPSQVP